MSYVAIARKWRPKTFKEIAGQKHITKTLENAIRYDRVHHAYLFSGPRGVGKTTAARTLARALNCEKGPSITPCGVCSNCKEILSGRSPDVIEIDGASNNSVDNVRDIRESAQYMPVKSSKKIYIVDEVHMLSKGAFNALLKTLEEPPSHILFLFATTEPQKIPDTILSRVQRFEFKRIPSKIVVERLKAICDAEEIQIAVGGLQLIARAGEGSMRDSQSLLDQVISFGGSDISVESVAEALGLIDRGLLYQMLEGIVFSRPHLCLKAIDTVYSYGYDLTEFSSEMLEVLRNATLLLLSDDASQYLNISGDEARQLEKIANKVTPDVLVRSFQVMLDTHEQLARSHRPKLVLEMSVARLITIRPAQPIDKLIERLGRLEQTQPNDKEPLPRRGIIQSSNNRRTSPTSPKSPLKTEERVAKVVVPQPIVQTSSVKQKKQEPSISKPQEKPPSIQPTKPKPKPKETASTTLPSQPQRQTKSKTLNNEIIQKRDQYYELFYSLRKEIKALGHEFDLLSNHAAIVEKTDTKLILGITDGFKLEYAKTLLKNPTLTNLFKRICPQLKKSSVIVKKSDSPFESFTERHARQREEKRDAVKNYLFQDSRFKLLNSIIPVEFLRIKLEEEVTS